MQAAEIAQRAQELSAQGLRVLTFARTQDPPDSSRLNGNTDPIALVTLSDQVRPDIQETLQAFRDQNVKLKVISGDNMETVKAVATQAGIPVEHAYIGDELEAMSEKEFLVAAGPGQYLCAH